jgi:DNA-binding NarL/FixJ family response regulator
MRVFVIDDHSLFRDGITSLLEAAGFTIAGECGDGPTAIQQIASVQPDLVLLDIHMEGMNGLEVLKVLKATWPRMRVVMLTVSESEADLLAAIRSGADGYLLKHLSKAEFFTMLEGLKNGEAAISRRTAALLMKNISQDKEKNSESRLEPLSEREIEILHFLASGLSNRYISERLSLSENTIKYHIKNILRKLQVQNRTEAVMRAMQMKLLD